MYTFWKLDFSRIILSFFVKLSRGPQEDILATSSFRPNGAHFCRDLGPRSPTWARDEVCPTMINPQVYAVRIPKTNIVQSHMNDGLRKRASNINHNLITQITTFQDA